MVCNQFTISFYIWPIDPAFGSVPLSNVEDMMAAYLGTNIEYILDSASYTNGIVSYDFDYSAPILGNTV